MPIEVRWYDDDETVMLFNIIGGWSIPEIIESMREAEAFYKADLPPIAFIVDMSSAVSFPQGILSASKDIESRLLFPDQSITIMVGASRPFRLLVNTLMRFGLAINLVFVDRLEDAEDFVAQYRHNLHGVE